MRQVREGAGLCRGIGAIWGKGVGGRSGGEWEVGQGGRQGGGGGSTQGRSHSRSPSVSLSPEDKRDANDSGNILIDLWSLGEGG